MTRTADLERAIDGSRFVFHLARANVKTWEEYVRQDIEVTRQVAETCLSRGIERLIYTGTIDSYYAGNKAGTITEATPLDPHLAWRNLYARAKAASEEILQTLHRERGLPVVILRPGIVIGRGGSPFHWGVGMWSWNAVCQVWGRGRNPLPLVLAEDVARALIAALSTPGIEGESFNLVADTDLTAFDYLEALEELRPRLVPEVPDPTVEVLRGRHGEVDRQEDRPPSRPAQAKLSRLGDPDATSSLRLHEGTGGAGLDPGQQPGRTHSPGDSRTRLRIPDLSRLGPRDGSDRVICRADFADVRWSDLSMFQTPVLVLGDVMLDRHVHGHVRRISPEAPVPVVNLVRRGSFARRRRATWRRPWPSLGCTVTLAGLIGTDDEGAQLARSLRSKGVAAAVAGRASGAEDDQQDPDPLRHPPATAPPGPRRRACQLRGRCEGDCSTRSCR